MHPKILRLLKLKKLGSFNKPSHKLKIIYNFDANLTTGNIETWLDKILISKGKMKDGLPHGEMKVYNEKGKVASIINFKKNTICIISYLL